MFVSPSELAKEWKVDVHKVLGFIHSGELPAINLAQDRNSLRPRYRISRKDIEAFERTRAAAQGTAARRRSTITRRRRMTFPKLV